MFSPAACARASIIYLMRKTLALNCVLIEKPGLRYSSVARFKLRHLWKCESSTVKDMETLDVLNRKLAESQLRLQTILQLSPIGIGITRLSDGAIIEFNDALLTIIGYERAEVIGRTSVELALWGDQEQRSLALSKMLSLIHI